MSISNLFTLKFFIFLAVAPTLGLVRTERPETPTWAKTTPYGHEHKTILQFYYHELPKGKNATMALIARAQARPKEPNNYFFGDLFMADDRLTTGPDPNSRPIGRAQGLSGVSAKVVGTGSINALVYAFTDGIYNGSSIVVLGRIELLNPNPVRELPVVSGTGVFRMARGYALTRTHYYDDVSEYVIIGYNVTIIHPLEVYIAPY